ncbi:MAG: 3-phosphoshikimate 1-carboxyvinyltransferase [Ruminococcaceae bacterium]|nr:3-phosphoshikimate 1-carboxyvinyltransferase [Oscillospiraceae bacterium]
MNVRILPSMAQGIVNAPPSKSMAHRALICGALSEKSLINNLAYSADIEATLSCLSSLGADIERNGSSVKIGGLDLMNVKDGTVLYCNESGSTLRFMIPLCLLTGKKITLTGAKRLFERPLSVYESICREQGILFEQNDNSLTLCGTIQSGSYRVRGDVSSQFITGLLYALPLLDGISILEVTEPFESSSYVDLTLSALNSFGIRITRNGNRFVIMGGQKYRKCEYTVEGDCSNAAFLDALSFLGGDVKVNGISEKTLQGDRVYKDYFEKIARNENDIDLSDCPDLAPILFAVAAAKGGAGFVGTARLRIKESDRANAMKEELAKFGVCVDVCENSVTVRKSALLPPNVPLNSHNDHRIVMSLAVLCSLTGGVIENAEAVAKSFPDFFSVLESLKVGIEYEA